MSKLIVVKVSEGKDKFSFLNSTLWASFFCLLALLLLFVGWLGAKREIRANKSRRQKKKKQINKRCVTGVCEFSRILFIAPPQFEESINFPGFSLPIGE